MNNIRDETKIHYSQVNTYMHCPRQYKFRYIDDIEFIKVSQPSDPLLIGTTMHLAAEKNYEEAKEFYYNEFNVITDEQINERIKIKYWSKRVHQILDDLEIIEKEYTITTEDYQGTIDLITKSDKKGHVDIWDYKYSNNIDNYDGTQLNLYKKFLELTTEWKVDNMLYIFIPKTFIRQKNEEDLYHFRKRIHREMENQDIHFKPVKYDEMKVKKFAQRVLMMHQDETYEKNPGKLCHWCKYEKICFGKDDYLMKLPENKRTDRRRFDKMDKWLIGASYSGKSTFMDQFDNVLFCNTDGNVDQITSPIVRIKDEIWTEGRVTKKKFAWEVFKDVVDELETNDEHGFERIVLDLVEDLYEHCRLYKYDDLDIEHESDAGYGKGWDVVRTEFLSTIKRLKNIGLEVTYCSKIVEKEINKPGGASVTTFNPNIQDKVANVLAGTVGGTFIIEAQGDDRKLTSGQSKYHFRGTRYDFPSEIPLNKDAYLKALEEALKSNKRLNVEEATVKEEKEGEDNNGEKKERKRRKTREEDTEEDNKEERTTRRRRRTK